MRSIFFTFVLQFEPQSTSLSPLQAGYTPDYVIRSIIIGLDIFFQSESCFPCAFSLKAEIAFLYASE